MNISTSKNLIISNKGNNTKSEAGKGTTGDATLSTDGPTALVVYNKLGPKQAGNMELITTGTTIASYSDNYNAVVTAPSNANGNVIKTVNEGTTNNNNSTPRCTNSTNSAERNNNSGEPGTKDSREDNNAGQNSQMDNSRISDIFGNHEQFASALNQDGNVSEWNFAKLEFDLGVVDKENQSDFLPLMKEEIDHNDTTIFERHDVIQAIWETIRIFRRKNPGMKF